MKKHNFKKNYYECLAKLVLENALPETFDDLELTDKPDLKKTDQIGIEVTRTFFEGEAHADGDVYKRQIFNCSVSRIRFIACTIMS